MSHAVGSPGTSPSMFLASWSELRGRLDPEMVLFQRRSQRFAFPKRRLLSFFSEPPQYGAGERGIARETPADPRYVRITDIDEFGMLSDELGATAERVNPTYVLEEDDLLIARSGNTVGKAYLHKQEHAPAMCFYAGYLIRFRFRRNEILPDYVFAITQLPYYKDWVKAVQRAAGQPNINAQEYSSFEIPNAPMPVQREVVALLQRAYDLKRRRDRDARALLTTIDDILHDGLGISHKPEPANTIGSRIFFRKLSDVCGMRLDPIASQDRRRVLEQAIRAGTYPVMPLHDLVAMPKTLVTDIVEGEIYVGLENIDSESGDYFSTAEKESVGTALRFESGQILFPKLRPYLNKTHLADFAGICSTEFHVFMPHGIEADFLKEFLRSRAIVGITSLLMTGNTLPRLQMSDIERLPIAVPPKNVQKSLCQKISGVRAKVRKLRELAQSDLEQAKRDIEALVLGNGTAA